jgi:hypothetical protein
MRGSLLTIATYSIGSLLFLTGCDQGKDYKPVDTSKNKTGDTINSHSHDEHGHEEGPHHGHIIELGNEEYHAELVYDAKAKTVGIYVLGSDAKTAQPIDAKAVNLNLKLDGKPVQLTLNAKPLEGEKEGKSSHFELVGNADLEAHAKDAEDIAGTLKVEIKGKQYSGEIAHDHDHGHDHDHDHDKAGEPKEADKKPAEEKGEVPPPTK